MSPASVELTGDIPKGGKYMYPEFIPIYIGLALLIILGIAILILLIILLKRSRGIVTTLSSINISKTQPQAYFTEGNMAFCKKCAAQFNASERVCPKCGTLR